MAENADAAESRWTWAVPLVALLLALTAMAIDPAPLRALRHAAFDQFQRWHPRSYDAPPVRVIDIDEESLRRHGQWPWSRAQMAQLLDAARRLGPSAVAVDIMFPEPERHGATPEGSTDAQLTAALERGRVVLGFALTGPSAVRDAEPGGGLLTKAGFITRGADPVRSVPSFSGSVTNLRDLQLAAAGQGAMTFLPDVDGIVRKVPLVLGLQGRPVPSLTAEALRVAAGADGFLVHGDAGDGGVIDVRIGDRVLATDATGALWVHFARPRPERYVPAWQVLAGQVPDEAFRGHVVLVGTSAQGLLDLRFSPLGGIVPGVEVHAQALEQVLSGQRLLRPGWAPALELLAALIGAIAVAAVALRGRAARSGAMFAVLFMVLGAGAWAAFTQAQLLLDPTGPMLALAAVFAPTSLLRHLRIERRQRWMKQTLSRYVSPNLLEYLIAHPQALELGGRRQRCSFVFTDLEGFTARMESMDPALAVKVLNTYLDRMIEIAFAHDGTLDRIVGDAVAIMFSAPVEQTDHEQRAWRCALQMQAFARAYVDELAREGIVFCETRIGVHTGEVTVGNFGGEAIFDYRALGDPVNTAARLEGANKYLGTRTCVSEDTRAGCAGVSSRPVGRVRLAGRTAWLTVHEPLAADGGDPAYGRAYALMQAGSDAAVEAFEALANERPTDRLVAMHRARLQAGQRNDRIDLAAK